MGKGVARIEVDSLLKEFGGAFVVVGAIAAQMLDAPQYALVGRQCRFALALLDQGTLDAAVQRRNDRPCHLVGNGENFGQRAVIGLAPELRAAAGVDQPHGDPHTVAETLQAALYEVADAKPSPDLRNI